MTVGFVIKSVALDFSGAGTAVGGIMIPRVASDDIEDYSMEMTNS